MSFSTSYQLYQLYQCSKPTPTTVPLMIGVPTIMAKKSDVDVKNLERMAAFGTQLVQGIVKAVGWKDLDTAMRERSDLVSASLGVSKSAYLVSRPN